MNKSRPDTALYFNEIASLDPDFIYLAGHLYLFDDDETEFTRFMRVKSDEWAHVLDMEEIAWSVCAFSSAENPRNCAVLGRDGEVRGFLGTEAWESQVPIKPGNAFQMSRIGDRVFVCGSRQQVFRWAAGEWELHSAAIAQAPKESGPRSFFGIGGRSANDFYCVGDMGVVAHFDGNEYTFIEAPTNRHLERVLCDESGTVFVCGNDGVFLKRTSAGGWEDINDSGTEDHFWGLAEFQSKIYAATASQVLEYDGTTLKPVKTEDIDPVEGFYRLTATSKFLWATSGTGDVYRFDGSKWSRIECPDNKA